MVCIGCEIGLFVIKRIVCCMGVILDFLNNLLFVLGLFEVIFLELISVYVLFVNFGYYLFFYGILRIEIGNGEVVFFYMRENMMLVFLDFYVV